MTSFLLTIDAHLVTSAFSGWFCLAPSSLENLSLFPGFDAGLVGHRRSSRPHRQPELQVQLELEERRLIPSAS